MFIKCRRDPSYWGNTRSNPERLNRLYKALSSELSEQLNVQVRYKPVTNYAAAVTAFRTGDLDLVWFGALTGVQAEFKTKAPR